jgi:hypothetical protein
MASKGIESKRNCLSGAERDRTVDLLNAIQALSQLSYSPFAEIKNIICDQGLSRVSHSGMMYKMDPQRKGWL